MPLQSQQIVSLALQIAKCPGFTSQGGQFLNSTLQDLCQNYDLDAALGSLNFTFNSGVVGGGAGQGQGSGPYQLPADYLRTQVKDGKDEFFYTINGVPYPLIQVTKAEYDWLVQTPGFNSYPYNYATDLSTVGTVGYPTLFVWPPASGAYQCTLRYYRLMPDIVTPETSAVVPWFLNTQVLIRGVAGMLMTITGDDRVAEFLGDDEEKFPLGVGTLLKKYLKNVEDREGAVHTVGKDRRRWGRPFDQLKNTKNIGWSLAAALLGAWMYFGVAVESAHANCTAPCTKSQVTTDINTNWPDNTAQLITPALLRSTVLDLVNSYLDVNGTSSFTCATHTWISSIATLSTYTCTQPAFTDISGTASNAQIPAPTLSALGGVEALSCPSHSWFSGLSVSGIFNCTQPTISDLVNIGANTFLGNNTGGSGPVLALTPAQAGANLCPQNTSYLTTGINTTYTTPTCGGALPVRIEFELVGSGGGGAGSGTTPGGAGTGNQSCWNTSSPACTSPLFSANGGGAGQTTGGSTGAGGTTTSCDLGIVGGVGQAALPNTNNYGGYGGVSAFGGAGPGGEGNAGGASAGVAAATNSGSGGGGGGATTTAGAGGGGGAGGYCRKILTSIASSYTYTVAAAGTAGTAGTGGQAGGAGGSGLIIARAFWQ